HDDIYLPEPVIPHQDLAFADGWRMHHVLLPYSAGIDAVCMQVPVDTDDTEIPLQIYRGVPCQIADFEYAPFIEFHFTLPADSPEIPERFNRPEFVGHIVIAPFCNAALRLFGFDVEGQLAEQEVVSDADSTFYRCLIVYFIFEFYGQRLRCAGKKMPAFRDIHEKFIHGVLME